MKSLKISQTKTAMIGCQVSLRFTDEFAAEVAFIWCQVSLQFTDKFTANWMSSQSSIHGRIRGRSGLHLGAKSVFNSRTNSQPIGCQVSLRFTDEFTANWVTSLSWVHGTKMAIVFFKMEKSFPQNSLEKKSQNCKDWELTFGLQLCTLASSK